MKDLLIIGAGGLGREVLQWAEDINQQAPKWNIRGFLDSNIAALENTRCKYSIVGDDEWPVSLNEEYVIAVANPNVRCRLAQSFQQRGALFAKIIHPSAFICDSACLAEGIIVYPHACISIDTYVGSHCVIATAGLGHDVSVGDYSVVSSFSNLMGHVSVGQRVFIGGNCAISPSVTIGDNAYIGMGSVVLHNVRPNDKVFGNPARKLCF